MPDLLDLEIYGTCVPTRARKIDMYVYVCGRGAAHLCCSQNTKWSGF